MFRLGGSGGGVNYQPYDPSVEEAKFSAKRQEIKDKTTYRAYESALKADVYRDANMGMLNEGLGLISNLLKQQERTPGADLVHSERLLEQRKAHSADTRTATKFVTDSLMSYLANSSNNNDYGGVK